MKLPEAHDVYSAARRIGSRVLRTPVLRSEALDRAAAAKMHFKAEHLQRTGSFKLRGAMNAVLSLSDEAAAKGVCAHSSGNHAAAVACAAAARGIPCTLVVPQGTPAAKIENARQYGATVVVCEPTQEARQQTAIAEAQRMGGAEVVHPYNDARVIAGQGTIGFELLEQVPELDAIVVPTSGGGMLTGIALAAKAVKPALRVFAAEPHGKKLGEAFSAGERVVDPANANALLPTVADAIRTQPLGTLPWEVAKSHVERRVLSVSDEEVVAAMRLTALHMKQLVEPAGAVALAALLSPAFASARREAEAEGARLEHVAAIVCGGNIEPVEWARLIGQ